MLIMLLFEIETKFENALACLSGAQIGSNHEKNGGWKSRDTLPLSFCCVWLLYICMAVCVCVCVCICVLHLSVYRILLSCLQQLPVTATRAHWLRFAYMLHWHQTADSKEISSWSEDSLLENTHFKITKSIPLTISTEIARSMEVNTIHVHLL